MTIWERILVWLQGDMPLPLMFGWFHLLSLFIVTSITLFIAFRFKNANDKTMRIILAVIASICLVFEIYKQIVFSFHYDPLTMTSSWVYQWYAFPFHFCSIPMYLAPIVALLKPGKVRQSIINFLGTFGLFGGLAVMIYAEPVFISTIGISIQTMVHHGSQVVMGVFLLSSHKAQLNFKALIGATIVFIIPVLMSIAMNIAFYASKGGSVGEFNMFWISPYYETQLPIMSAIRPLVAYPVFVLIYIAGFTLLAAIVLASSIVISRIKPSRQFKTSSSYIY